MRGLLVMVFTTAGEGGRPWMDDQLPPMQRAQLLLASMTLIDKTHLMHGPTGGGDNGNCREPSWPAGVGYTGCVPANPRLSIPALKLNDGPQVGRLWR